MKKLLSLLCVLSLSAALLVTGVCAAEGSVELTAGTQAEGPVLVWGTVQEIGEGRIRLENSNDQDPYREIVLVVGPETAILDAVTGAPRIFAGSSYFVSTTSDGTAANAPAKLISIEDARSVDKSFVNFLIIVSSSYNIK